MQWYLLREIFFFNQILSYWNLLCVCLWILVLWITLIPFNSFKWLRRLVLLLDHLLLSLLLLCQILWRIRDINLVYETILRTTILSLIPWIINHLLLLNITISSKKFVSFILKVLVISSTLHSFKFQWRLTNI